MFNFLKTINTTHIKLLTVLFVFAFVTGVYSDPTEENIVEDPQLLGTDIEGADPNIAFVLDLSGS